MPFAARSVRSSMRCAVAKARKEGHEKALEYVEAGYLFVRDKPLQKEADCRVDPKQIEGPG